MRKVFTFLIGVLVVMGSIVVPVSVANADTEGDLESASTEVVDLAETVAATRKVCTPKKCVTVAASKYCYPDSGCGQRLYKDAGTGYCSSSTGCFTYKGKNYRYTGYSATPAQHLAAQKCAAGLGVTWLGAIAGGPAGITILGVAISLWGCSS